MIDLILAQSGELSADWVKWIVGGLVAAISAMAYFIKSVIGQGWKQLHEMHNDVMMVLKESNTRAIETKGDIEEMKTDYKEIKYAVQTLNRKVRCQNEEA